MVSAKSELTRSRRRFSATKKATRERPSRFEVFIGTRLRVKRRSNCDAFLKETAVIQGL